MANAFSSNPGPVTLKKDAVSLRGADPLGEVDPSGRDGGASIGEVDPLDDGCQAMLARLYHFLDGELTDERRAMIESHLNSCPSCFSAYDFEAELRIVVAARCQCEVPQNLVERIRTSLRSEGFPRT